MWDGAESLQDKGQKSKEPTTGFQLFASRPQSDAEILEQENKILVLKLTYFLITVQKQKIPQLSAFRNLTLRESKESDLLVSFTWYKDGAGTPSG